MGPTLAGVLDGSSPGCALQPPKVAGAVVGTLGVRLFSSDVGIHLYAASKQCSPFSDRQFREEL